MRCSLLIAAAVAPWLLTAATDASAQPHFGGGGFRAGGFHGGGFHGGGFRGGGFYGRGIGMRPYGLRPAFPGYRPGWGGRGGWQGAGFYPRRPYWGGYYPYRRWGGYYPYWGAAAGFATAAAIGAAATYPGYGYPVYPAYQVEPTASGGQCSTAVKVCTLYEPAPLGTGCSCRVSGGRARGTVVGPW